LKEIKFKEHDLVGKINLDVIAEADKFNRWMYNNIKPFCKGKILEIGSGIGNISNFFIQDNFELMLTDIRQGYCSKLEILYSNNKCFLGTEVLNLTDIDFDVKYTKHIGQYDTVFALNVVEHIYDDMLAFKNCHKLLNRGGHLIILVPSYQKLYNNFDKELGHYRRYNKATISNLFLKSKFNIIHKQYFNFFGIFGWYLTGSLLKKKTIPRNQMKFYNLLVPIFKIIDKLLFNSVGLSTIVVGKKI